MASLGFDILVSEVVTLMMVWMSSSECSSFLQPLVLRIFISTASINYRMSQDVD
jgi:hypothetical protein